MNTSTVLTQTSSGLFARLGNFVFFSALTNEGDVTPNRASKSFASTASAPLQGNAMSFAVLAGSAVTNTGSSIITGNLGVNPGTAVTGSPPSL